MAAEKKSRKTKPAQKKVALKDLKVAKGGAGKLAGGALGKLSNAVAE